MAAHKENRNTHVYKVTLCLKEVTLLCTTFSYCSHNWVSVEGLYSSLLVAASESAIPVAIIKLMVTFDVHAFL